MLRWISLWVLLALATQSSCVRQTGMTPPAGWQASARASSDASAWTGRPRMQVIICYAWLISSHACLRLDSAADESLFWDPGGGYGQNMPGVHRRSDVLLDRSALSLDQVWIYRRTGCDEPGMLVFEWTLTPEQASKRRQILEQAMNAPQEHTVFHTDAPGGKCSVYVSRFLTDHCPELQSLKGSWFWPHNLARTLWRHKPDRVLIYRRGQPVMQYQRLDGNAREASSKP